MPPLPLSGVAGAPAKLLGNLVLSNSLKERSRQKAHVSCLVTASGFGLRVRHSLISLTIFRQRMQQPDSGPSLRLDFVFQFFKNHI